MIKSLEQDAAFLNKNIDDSRRNQKMNIDVSSDGYRSYSSLESILTQAGSTWSLEKSYSANLEHSNIYSSGPNEQAIQRRVSRESVSYSKTVLEGAAQLEQALVGKKIVFTNFDLVDRPSAKAIALAIRRGKINPPTIEFRDRCSSEPSSQIYSGLRRSYLNRFFKDLNSKRTDIPNLSYIPSCDYDYTSNHFANDLVLGNVEKIVREIDGKPLVTNYESYRLFAIVLITQSCYRSADSILDDIIFNVYDIKDTYKSHLYYLKGLIRAKGTKDIASADVCFKTGKELLRGNDSLPEVALEKAWLMNGEALNCILKYKKSKDYNEWKKAFYILNEAFELAEVSNSAPFIYLRYNLLSNTSMLLEIIGDFDNAERTLSASFSNILGKQSYVETSPFLYYRIGILLAKKGQYEASVDMLNSSLESAKQSLCPFFQEKILRGLTVVYSLMSDNLNRDRSYDLALGIAKDFKIQDSFGFLESLSNIRNHKAILDDLPSKLPVFITELEVGEILHSNTNLLLSKIKG